MNSLVIQLQQDILEDKDILLLLREARIIGEDLELNNFVKWIDLELNGYNDLLSDNLPDYRKIKCPIRADAIQNNIYQSMKITNAPIQGLPQEFQEILEIAYIFSPVSEIKNLSESDVGFVRILIPSESQNILRELINVNVTEIYRACTKFQLKSILDQIKNELLKWTSELKKQGILGKNSVFNSEEKESAKENIDKLNIYIINSNVQFGNNNQINVNSTISNEINCITRILKYEENNISNKDEITKNINIIESEIKKEEPNYILIKEKTNYLKNIVEKIGVDIIVALIMPHIISILNVVSALI